MKLPFIIIVDDDLQVLRAIHRDVRNRYREEYSVVSTESANEALELLKELKLKNEAIALVISDQRMPEMEGVEFLTKSKEIHPEIKQILLTAYSDIQAAITAINDLKLDYYLLKPWNPPEEKLYPVIDELLDEWHASYKPDEKGIRLIGFQWSPKTHLIKEFLAGNLIPFRWLDAENLPEAKEYLKSSNKSLTDLPLVVYKDGNYASNPEIQEIANEIGLRTKASKQIFDVVIIGAGPSGLAASVYGSSEGLKTLLIEKQNPGGQASRSSRIENYLGFPSGVSGAELTRRAITQATRFGAEILSPQEVNKIKLQDGYKIIELADKEEIHTKSIVVASGVTYRSLNIEGIENYTGAGVYYGSASVEGRACKDKVVYIIGGGNSACQAAMYLCKFAREVNIVIRKERLSQTAAFYLVENISNTPNIKIIGNTELTAVSGKEVLEEITLKNNQTNEDKIVQTNAIFIYIGAKPSTEWLDNLVLKTENGLIITGNELSREKTFHTKWKLERTPYLSESSVPGIFASGDVRSGALTGISSAVGEGAMAIRFVRKYLNEG